MSAGLALRPAHKDDLEGMIETARRAWLSAFAKTAPFALNERALTFDRRKGYVETGRDRYLRASCVPLEDVRLERALADADRPSSR